MKELLFAVGGYFVLRSFFGIDLLTYFTHTTPATTPTTSSPGTSLAPDGGPTPTNTTVSNGTTVNSPSPTNPSAGTNPGSSNTNFSDTDWVSAMNNRMASILMDLDSQGYDTGMLRFNIDQWNALFAGKGTINLPGIEAYPGVTRDELFYAGDYLNLIHQVAKQYSIQGLNINMGMNGMGRLLMPTGRVRNAGYFQPDGAGHASPVEKMVITRW